MSLFVRLCFFTIFFMVRFGIAMNLSAQEQNGAGPTRSAAVNYGVELEKQKKYAEAAVIFKRAAAEGDLQSMTQLGNMYRDADDGSRDYATALVWFKKAAAGGDPEAMVRIGSMYETNCGLPLDLNQAINWYQQADKAASATSQKIWRDYANAMISVDLTAKDDPVKLASIKCTDAPELTIKQQQISHKALIRAMNSVDTLVELRHELIEKGTYTLVSLDLVDGVLQIDESVSVTAVPLIALNANGIEAQASSSGGAFVEFHVKPGTPDDLIAEKSADRVLHEGSFQLRFTDITTAANAAADFSHLVEIRDSSNPTNWLDAARTDWKRAAPAWASPSPINEQPGPTNLPQGTLFAAGDGQQQQTDGAQLIAQQRAKQQQVAQDDSDRQDEISELRSDIEMQLQNARDDESSANQVLNNCSGPGVAICQTLGELGAAKFRQDAVKAKNKADEDREEIQRLEGEQVETRQRRDTSFGSSLQQVTTENGTSIQNAAAQQQANLQAMTVDAQQRQHAEMQARAAAVQNTRLVQTNAPSVRPTSNPSNITTTSSPGNASSGSNSNSSFNPYSTTPTPGSYNPYTGAGTGSIQTKCIEVTTSVASHTTWHSPSGSFCQKELDVFFTNNNAAAVSCTWAYLKDGVWRNYGGGIIQSGETLGGESGGDWTCSPDSGEIKYMCFLKAENETKACSKQLPSDWK